MSTSVLYAFVLEHALTATFFLLLAHMVILGQVFFFNGEVSYAHRSFFTIVAVFALIGLCFLALSIIGTSAEKMVAWLKALSLLLLAASFIWQLCICRDNRAAYCRSLRAYAH